MSRMAIFISYSHSDAGLVKPVVGLLRATKGLVFQDTDSIRPAAKWREEIRDAIRNASLIIIFWCRHSSESAEVREEYELATKIGKDVLPVLLDTTTLPEELATYQWVDFRNFARLTHQNPKVWGIILGVLMMIVPVLFFTFEAPPPEPPSPVGFHDSLLFFPVVLFGILLVGMVFLWMIRHRDQRSESQKQMAEQLREELARRNVG